MTRFDEAVPSYDVPEPFVDATRSPICAVVDTIGPGQNAKDVSCIRIKYRSSGRGSQAELPRTAIKRSRGKIVSSRGMMSNVWVATSRSSAVKISAENRIDFVDIVCTPASQGFPDGRGFSPDNPPKADLVVGTCVSRRDMWVDHVQCHGPCEI